MNKKKNNFFSIMWYSHPRITILLALIAINLLVILAFTGILAIVSGNNFFSELAYIFTYTMCSDGIYDFVNSQEDVICFVIKIILTVVQMIIFSGALIGFATNVIESAIDKSLKNVGKISLSNHYVFLNWSSIGANIIYDLSFLEGRKNIVILTDEDRDNVLYSIQNIFIENKRKLKNVRLFIKNGNPNSAKHLNDVSLSSAKYVGILLPTTKEENKHFINEHDISSLKSLFSIMNVAKNANIVVETENNDTVNIIEQLLDTIDKNLAKRIIVFSHNSVIGNILGKTIIKSDFSDLYHDLLSYEGCEFYGIEPMEVEQALYTYNDCIPIINYDDDDEVDEGGNKQKDQLYVLSDNKQTLGKRQELKSFIKPLSYNKKQDDKEYNVFIFSQSKNPKFIVDELNNYQRQNNVKINCKQYSYQDDFDIVIKDLKSTNGIKKIVLLSSDEMTIENNDENIFISALKLKLNNCMDSQTEIIAEIINPLNLNSLKNFGVVSVIISNRILSLFMVQLLTHPGSKKFYRDIISTNDDSLDAVDLDVVSVQDVLEFNTPTLTFNSKSELVQSFYMASNKTSTCIGIKYFGQTQVCFLCDKMDEQQTITLSKQDKLIVVNY